MKQQRTNAIQINKDILIEYRNGKLNKISQNMKSFHDSSSLMNGKYNKYNNVDIKNKEMIENNIKCQNDIDDLIKNTLKEFDMNDLIKKYKEEINKRNEEIIELKQEKKDNEFLQHMKLDAEIHEKRIQEMELEFRKKLNDLDEKRNKELKELDMLNRQRMNYLDQKSLEEDKKFQEQIELRKKYVEEIRQKDLQKHEMELKHMDEIERLNKIRFEEMRKQSKDLNEEKKRNLQMRNDLYKIESENRILSYDNNRLKNLNQMNQQIIQNLNGLRSNTNRNDNSNYTLNNNNYYYRNDNQYDSTNFSQSFPNYFNNNI